MILVFASPPRQNMTSRQRRKQFGKNAPCADARAAPRIAASIVNKHGNQTKRAPSSHISLQALVVVNTTPRAIRQRRPVYLIAANLDGEFVYIDHCFVALHLRCPYRPLRNRRCQRNIHSKTIVFNRQTEIIMDAKVRMLSLCLPSSTWHGRAWTRCDAGDFISKPIRFHPDCLPSTAADRLLCSHNALRGLSVYATRTRRPNCLPARLCTRATSQHQHCLH
jgi:hypothetical protein